jgi:hypothetical protein
LAIPVDWKPESILVFIFQAGGSEGSLSVRSRQSLFISIVVVLFTTALSGEIDYESARHERRLKPMKTTERIMVDGRLEEASWSQTDVAGNFIQNEPQVDQPASEATEVRILYDHENLYIGILARDSEPERVIVNDLKKDFERDRGDTVEIVLDTFHDQRNGYLFATNAAGAKWDAQMTNEGRQIDANWDAIWTVKTRTEAEGWTAEIAIPFKTLKFREANVQTWGINFQRRLRRKNEDSFWSPLPRIFNLNRVSLAGTLEGLEGIQPGSNLRIKPYAVSTFGQFAGGRRNLVGDLGVDAKYGLTPGLSWDFTYNTDFSQVEADEQQINLTRFNLFFPEKREFFLENSGIFAFGGSGRREFTQSDDLILFFSRNIGLSEEGRPIPIRGGTRLSGRAGPWELGFLNIQQQEFGEEPAANFTVARVRRNIFTSSDIGVMLVNKEAVDSPYFNRVAGVDANFRFGQALSVYSFLAKSFTPGGGGDAKDMGGRIGLNYENNVWDFRSAYTSVQEDFVDEVGFAPRLGIRKVSGFAGRLVRPERWRGLIREFSAHSNYEFVLDREGTLETQSVNYHFSTRFQNSSWVEVGYETTLERFREDFLINRNRKIAIPPGGYRFSEWFLVARSDESKRISAQGRYRLGGFYSGFRHQYELEGRFRWSYKLNTSVEYTHNNISLPEGRFKTNLLATRADYSFSTNMFLNALIQYNNDSRQWSSNVRFNIIHRPLSDFFLVYNERRHSITGDLIDRALIAKFTYMIAR